MGDMLAQPVPARHVVKYAGLHSLIGFSYETLLSVQGIYLKQPAKVNFGCHNWKKYESMI